MAQMAICKQNLTSHVVQTELSLVKRKPVSPNYQKVYKIMNYDLSYDVMSESVITSCIKNDNPLED